MIGSMPEKGTRIYEQRYGPEANKRLADGKKNKDDLAILADVVGRYRHTLAGREALELLVSQQKSASVTPEDSSSWPMFGGNAARSAQAKGGTPLLKSKWSQAMHVHFWGVGNGPTLAEQWVNDAVKVYENRHIPILPAFYPIAATIQKDGKALPLVIYRSYYGIHAVNALNGKLYWEANSMLSIDSVVRDPQKGSNMGKWVATYGGTTSNPLLENSTLGTLSTDNTYVYLVDDLAVPPHPNFMMQMQLNGVRMNFGSLDEYVRFNRLQAFELNSGKIEWELGGRGVDSGELGDSYFLGPPLPLDGRLYALNEKNGEIRLICLDPAKNWNQGENPIVWKQKLGTVRDQLLTDATRRVQAVNISYSDGILVCPTNTGTIMGFDLRTRSLIWAYSYRKTPAAESNDNQMQRMTNRRGGMDAAKKQQFPSGYAVSAPVIQKGNVVFTAPDCNELHCIRLKDGTGAWEAARSDDLFLGGAYDGKVLLVGRSTCRALSLADGKELWKMRTGLPSGRGVAAGNVYYLPLKAPANSGQPAVCTIDIDKGAIVATIPSQMKVDGQYEVPGNLLFFAGNMISQNVAALTAYPQ
jgi:outer membrane protein assembly factor BamB